jgi:hypothetical protein
MAAEGGHARREAPARGPATAPRPGQRATAPRGLAAGVSSGRRHPRGGARTSPTRLSARSFCGLHRRRRRPCASTLPLQPGGWTGPKSIAQRRCEGLRGRGAPWRDGRRPAARPPPRGRASGRRTCCRPRSSLTERGSVEPPNMFAGPQLGHRAAARSDMLVGPRSSATARGRRAAGHVRRPRSSAIARASVGPPNRSSITERAGASSRRAGPQRAGVGPLDMFAGPQLGHRARGRRELGSVGPPNTAARSPQAGEGCTRSWSQSRRWSGVSRRSGLISITSSRP